MLRKDRDTTMKCKIRVTFKRENVWTLLYCFALLTFIMSYICGLTSYSYKSVCLLTMTYLFSYGAFMSFFFFTNRPHHILYQLLTIYLFATLFFDLSYFSKYVSKTYELSVLFGGLTINLPVIIMLVYIGGRKSVYYRVTQIIRGHWELVGLIFLFILFSCETLNTITRGDSNIYYTYLQNAKSWDLSFNTISLFKLGGHQSIGYTIWGLLGAYLSPNTPLGIRIVNIIMVCVSILALYCILEKLLPLKTYKRVVLFLATCLFAFNPIVLGTIYDINLDLPALCFYLWALYSLLYNKKIFLFFSSVFLLFSKETGIILLLGIVFGWVVTQLYMAYINNKKNFWKNPDHWQICCMTVPCIIMVLTLCFSSLWRQDRMSAKNNTQKQPMDSFGINFDNTIIKLKELFCLNFAWIFSLFILICIVALLLQKRRFKANKNIIIQSMPILVSFAMFVSFQFVYITYSRIRYIVAYLPGFLFVFLFLIIITYSPKQAIAILSITTILLLCECFYTLDPVSRQLCDTIDIGCTRIISTRTFVRDSDYSIRTPKTHPELIKYFQLASDSAACNRQYLYFLWAFEKFIDEIDYDDNTYIAVAPIYEIDNNNMTWISLFGHWYSNELFYDNRTHKLVEDTSKTSLNISVIKDKSEVPYAEYDRVFLISFPYNKLFDNDKFLSSFDVKNYFKVCKRGWEIQVYQIK